MATVAAPSLLRLTPRPYQHEAVAALLAAAARGVHRPLLVLPTGTGKTIIFALLVQRRGGRALILAHREPIGSERAHPHDWLEIAARTFPWRVVGVCLFALLLAGVVPVVRYMLLRREHRLHTAVAVHEKQSH